MDNKLIFYGYNTGEGRSMSNHFYILCYFKLISRPIKSDSGHKQVSFNNSIEKQESTSTVTYSWNVAFHFQPVH